MTTDSRQTIVRAIMPAFVHGLIAAVAGIVVALSLPSIYAVRSGVALNSPASAASGAGLLGLAQQFGLGGAGGMASPDFLLSMLRAEDLLERVVTTPFPASTYRELRRTGCEDGAASCPLYLIYGTNGKNPRDSLIRAAEQLYKSVKPDVNTRSGVVSLEVRARTPELALAISERLLFVLDSANATLQRTQAAQQFEFVQARLDSARIALSRAEGELRSFDTRNRIIVSSPILQGERARLQRNVALAEAFYTQLMGSVQQSYLAATNSSATLSIVERPLLPGRRNSPKRRVIVMLAFAAGVAIWGVRRYGRLALTEALRVLTLSGQPATRP